MTTAITAYSEINPDTIDFDSLTWVQEYQKHNTVIHIAAVENHDIKAFRAVSTFDASLQQMVGAITDMTRFTDWMHGAKEAYVVKKLADNVQACYFRNDVPFPLKDRDGVIVQKVIQEAPGRVRIHLNLMNELVPEDSHYVRVDHLEGDWLIEDLGDGKVQLTYQIHLDPQGMIPDWAVNFLITETPSKSLKNLKKVDFSFYANQASDLLSVN